MGAVIIDGVIYFPFYTKHGHGLCFCGNRKSWYQNYDVNEWIFIYLLIHSQRMICTGNLDVTSIRISLKRTKKNGSMCWQRALHIFWQDSNNESKASCSLACFLFPFSSPNFSLYFLFCCLSEIVLLVLLYWWNWMRLLDKRNEILIGSKGVYF